MAFTCEFHDTVKDRLCRDSAFFEAMLDEAIMAIDNGEPQVAQLILDDLSSCFVDLWTILRPGTSGRLQTVRLWKGDVKSRPMILAG